VPVDALGKWKIIFLSDRSAYKFRVNDTIRTRESLCQIFQIHLCQPTYQRSVVGEHRGKIGKEMGKYETKIERENISI